MDFDQAISQVLDTARDFLSLLREMEVAYDSAANERKRWVYKDQEVISSWIAGLEAVQTPGDLNGIWREVQNISRILGCTVDDDLGDRYRALQSRLFEGMENALQVARHMQE